MAVLAIDIGTTKICVLVMDEESGEILETQYADDVFLPAVHPWDRTQNPEQIFGAVESIAAAFLKKYRTFRCVGISSQMHGILYVDSAGRALSPYYTWQDMSASLEMKNGESYAGYLAKFSPGPVAPGYGLATCFYHLLKKEIPAGTAKICGIGDYVGMRLCSRASPASHVTNTGGMGFFDLRAMDFDHEKMERVGLDPSLLPEVISGGKVLGEFSGGIPVCVAVGDNQAAFLGSATDSENSLFVNIGTGSQIAFIGSGFKNYGTMEARPFFEGRYIHVGASLCGGRAYAILERFFRQVLGMAGFSAASPLYDIMNTAASSALEKPEESFLEANPLFAGTRKDPSERGSILNISEDNFTPAQLTAAFIHGIAGELYDFYLPVKKERGGFKRLVGAGNGIRKNAPLKKILARTFDMPLEIPRNREEAAFGAALFALASTGYFKNVFDAQSLVKYQDNNSQ